MPNDKVTPLFENLIADSARMFRATFTTNPSFSIFAALSHLNYEQGMTSYLRYLCERRRRFARSLSESPVWKLFHLLPSDVFHQQLDPVHYRSTGSLFQLLSDASTVLKLHGPAKQTYTQDVKAVKSFEFVRRTRCWLSPAASHLRIPRIRHF
jgi:hypothetical protein